MVTVGGKCDDYALFAIYQGAVHRNPGPEDWDRHASAAKGKPEQPTEWEGLGHIISSSKIPFYVHRYDMGYKYHSTMITRQTSCTTKLKIMGLGHG